MPLIGLRFISGPTPVRPGGGTRDDILGVHVTEIIVFNKPYGVLSQFTDEDSHRGLAHYIQADGYYAAGRLDRDSEGLLILTNLGQLQARISSPKYKLPKIYLAQIEGEVTETALQNLRAGVTLKDGKTLPAEAEIIAPPEWLWSREPPVRQRKTIPDSWIKLVIREGKNRQVRRMTAAVGLPTLRLIRYSVGEWSIDNLAPGAWRYEPVPEAYLTNLPTNQNHRGSGKKRSVFNSQVKRRGK